MKVVIDSNRVIASLLRDSTTREILYNRRFDFIAPEFIKVEIQKYKTQKKTTEQKKTKQEK
mgnify:CR=1 FL=1